MPRLFEPGATVSSEDDKKKKKQKQQPAAVVVPTSRRTPAAPKPASTFEVLGTSLRDKYASLTDEWHAQVAAVEARREANPTDTVAGELGTRSTQEVAREYEYTPQEKATEIVGYTPEQVQTARQTQMGIYHQARTLEQVDPQYIDHRLQGFDPRVVDLAPDMVFKAAFYTQTHGREYAKQVKAFNQTILWEQGRDRMGIEDGALAAARLYAVQTGNQDGLELLKLVQTMPRLQQDAWLRQMRDPNAALLEPDALEVNPETGVATSTVPGWSPQEIQALEAAGTTMHEQYGLNSVMDDEGNIQYTMPNEERGADLVAGMHALFPRTADLFKVAGPDGWQELSASLDLSAGGTGQMSGYKRLLSVGAPGIGKKTLRPGGDPNNPDDYIEQGGPVRAFGVPIPGAGPAAKGANIALAVGAKPFEAAGEAWRLYVNTVHDWAEAHSPHLGLVGGDPSGALASGIANSPIELFNDGFTVLDTAVHAPIDLLVDHALTGADEGTSDDVKNALAGMTELFIMNRVSEASRAAQTGRTMLPEDARAQLGITDSLGETSFGGERSFSDSGFAHPLEYTKNVARRVGFEMGGFKTIAQAMSSRVVQKNFDWVQRINEKYSGSHQARVAAIRNLWGDSMPIALAETLAEVPRGEMAGAFTAYAERASRTSYRIDLAKKNIARHREILDRVANSDTQDALARRAFDESVPLEERQAASIEVLQNDQLAAETRLLIAHEEISLLNMAGDLQGLPVYEYMNASSVRRFFRDEALGTLAHRVAENFFVKKARNASLKLVDEISNTAELFAPENATNPLDWREHNIDTATSFLDRLGISDASKKQLVGELATMKTRTEFYNWQKRVAYTIEQQLKGKHLPAEVMNELTQWHHRSIESGGQLFVTGQGTDSMGNPTRTSEPVVPGYDPANPNAPRTQALPSAPHEFVGNTRLPRADLLIEATSNIRRLVRFGKRNRWSGGGLIELPYHTFRGVTSAFTAALKSPILGTRFVAMAQRIQFEQALRARLYGGYKPFVFFPGGLMIPGAAFDWITLHPGSKAHADMQMIGAHRGYEDFAPPSEQSLGGIHAQLADATGHVQYQRVETTRLNDRSATPSTAHYQAVVETLQALNGNYLDKAFAREGLDVAAMEEYIASNTKYQEFVRDQVLPQLRQSSLNVPPVADEVLVHRWLERRGEAIRELTNNDPAKIDAIATGEYRAGTTAIHGTDPRTGLPWDEALNRIHAEQRLVKARLRQTTLPLEEAEARALHAKKRELDRQSRQIRDEHGATGDSEPPIRLDDAEAIRSALEEEYRARQFDFPQTISVKRRYGDVELTGARQALSTISEGWNTFWYTPLKLVSWSDVKGTRGSLYYQMADHYRNGLIERGYSPESASAYAQVKAAAQVRDLMYDLAQRSSSERALKDTFWFAPAAKEAMYTWGVKIPSRYYGGSIMGHGAGALSLAAGYALMAAKGKAWMNLFRGLGVIVKNKEGEEVVQAPFLDDVLDAIVPDFVVKGGFDDVLSFKPKGFNLVASSPVPALSTPLAFMLSEEGRIQGGLLRDLSETFNSQGQDVTMVPRQISGLYEALTGKPFPFEVMSSGYAKAMSDRSMDQAIQWAYADQIHAGNLPPRPEDFATPDLYKAAQKKYVATLKAEAQDYFSSVAFKRWIGSTAMPASLQVGAEEREDWRSFFAKVIDPLGNEEKTGKYTEEQRNLIDQFVGNHPYSLGYTVGYTAFGDKQKDLPFEPNEDEAFYERLYTGESRVLEPDEFIAKMLAVESYRFYIGQERQALSEIPGGDTASGLLSNGSTRMAAMSAFSEDWNTYLAYNNKADALLKDTQQHWAEKYGIPQETYEVQRLSQTITALGEMSSYFTGESGIRDEAYVSVQGQLKALYSDKATFGEPTTQVGKDMAWYYDTVLTPYFDQTEDLYSQAGAYSAVGDDASAAAVYEQIKEINNGYTNQMHHGQSFPTPEEVFFGNKPPAEQEAAINGWRTKPPTWLTDFQLDKAGVLPDFEGRSALLEAIGTIDRQLGEYIASEQLVSGSSDYEDAQAQADDLRKEAAAPYGSAGAAVIAAYNQPPIGRLISANYGSGNLLWSQMAAGAASVAQNLENKDLSAKGWGEDAAAAKISLYTAIEQQRDIDPTFDTLWDDLAESVPEPNGIPRQGAPLYDAILFGNFGATPIPQWAIDQIGASTNG